MPEQGRFDWESSHQARRCLDPCRDLEPAPLASVYHTTEAGLTIAKLADLYGCGYAPPTRQRIVEALDGSEEALIQLRHQIQEDVTRKLVDLLRKQDPLAIWNGIVNRTDWRTLIDPIHKRTRQRLVRREWLLWYLLPTIETFAELQRPELAADLRLQLNLYRIVHPLPDLDHVLELSRHRSGDCTFMAVYRKAAPTEYNRIVIVSNR